MKFEKTETWGFEHAIRGMRNPKESWEKSESHKCNYCNFEMGDYSDLDFIEVDNKVMGSHKLIWIQLISYLELLKMKYNETKDKRYWKELIRLLPESWLQKRTVTMNYENLLNICSKGQRRNHKLTEWSLDFMGWAKTLPYAEELIFLEENHD